MEEGEVEADSADIDELLRVDLQALVEAPLEGSASIGSFSDTVLRGYNGQVDAHMALLGVRCPGLAEKAICQPSEPSCEFLIQMPETPVETLQNVVFFLYTDRIAPQARDNVGQMFALLRVARDLYLPEKSDSSTSSGCKRRRVDTRTCAMRRLSSLCEHRIRELLTASTVIEILSCSVKLRAALLESCVYKFLAESLPARTKDVDFSRSLIDTLGKDHPDVLAKAISATAGNTPASSLSAAAAPPVPPPSLLLHLQSLWRQTLGQDQGEEDMRVPAAKPDCKLNLGRGKDSLPCHVLAHRFLLAARSKFYACALSSPMREAQTGDISLGVIPSPSVGSVRTLLKYLYTGRLEMIEGTEGHDAMPTDLLDMLSIVDGPGGQNYLQLSQAVCDLLRDQLTEQIKANLRQDNMWMVLRRATAQRNRTIQKEAFMAVLSCYAELSRDEELFRCWGDCPVQTVDAWWTQRMETELLREMLRLSCTLGSGRQVHHDNWELEVVHPAPEGVDNVFNLRGNGHLLQEWSDRGSACARRGSIVAKFKHPVHVDFVTVAPLDGWGSEYLKNARLHVKNADGVWERLATATGRVEQIPVFRRATMWRLYGDEVATAVLKFRKEPARPCTEFEHTEKARCKGSDGTYKFVYFKFPVAVHVDDVTVPADPILTRTQLQVKNADGQWVDVGAPLTGRSQLVWVNRDGRFWRLRNLSGLTGWDANIFTFTSK